jgi:phosphate acetyltransferase
MGFVESMREKAKGYGNRLVLPEGTEMRTLKAARIIVDEGIASELTLLGEEGAVAAAAQAAAVSLEGIRVVDPLKSAWLGEFAAAYYEKRKAKGLSPEQARVDIAGILRFGAMMVAKGRADAMVSGAESTTADLLRAGLTVIGTAPGTKTASSCFVMELPDKRWGAEGLMIFSDCAVIPQPSPEQLADIAQSAARSCREFLGAEPVVALLSFSTKGSGGGDPAVLAVQEAVKLLTERKPDFVFDGELQADAALVPEVTRKKAPGSPVTGRVNTIVFPNLGAGNIGYKLVQRLAGAGAYGPFLQGFAAPLSDLSRGCSVEDIVTTAAVTLVQAGRR